jgi:hypothetical protein
MSVLETLEWSAVRRHYDQRSEIHRELLHLSSSNSTLPFVRLALGISDPAGNYSADEHKLGPQILSSNLNANQQVFNLARQFMTLQSARTVPDIIRKAAIRFLKIGVGSELSCMLNPEVCWVANTRSIWAHLVVKHADSFARANEELMYYRTQDDTSEMAYRLWAAIHAELATSMTRIAEEGQTLARRSSVSPGEIKFLWADAIANALYEKYYE